MKLWSQGKVKKEVLEFTVGDDYLLDQMLVKYDCLASSAHVKMLGKIGLLEAEEVARIVTVLEEISQLAADGKFKISQEQEDSHTAIENYLTGKLGKLGEKIHAGRSRNDQVMAALGLYYRAELQEVVKLLGELMKVMKKVVKDKGQVKIPGYTHTRKAMPSSLGLWGKGFLAAWTDDVKLLEFTKELINQCPLGSGAGYGVPLAVDKEFLAKELGFGKVQETTYVQNSRGKFATLILSSLTQVMLDLNKLASDLIFFSLPQLGYLQLPYEFCTGSSIMPHKNNPDVMEIIRGNYHLLAGYGMQVQGISGNLISGYHRDLQLLKKPVMESFKLTKSSLEVMTLLLNKIKVNEENCKNGLTDELYATEQVYQQVKEGVPFRQAYHQVKSRL